MAQLNFGTKRQIHFASDNAFFEALGFLSKNNGTTSIHWEHNENQGAWGSEGRIHCYRNIGNFPTYFSSAFTAGTGNIIHRINCNAYVQYIVQNFGFSYGATQNIAAIRALIPASNIVDYDRGLVI